MKVAAMVLGIVGGMWGALLSFLVAAVAGRVMQILGGGSGLTLAGIAALLLSVVGIVGGVLVMRKPMAGVIMLLIGSIGMIIILAHGGVHWAVIVPLLMLILAGLLALVASRKRVST